jgi:ABC-type transport system substrate-binding protein
LIADRNPYYWRVDPQGNQLPYIDQLRLDLVQNNEAVNLKAINGELDMQFRNIDIAKYSLLQENKQKGDYRVMRWDDANGSPVSFFVNQTIDDPDLRPVFQDLRFRQALSYAINRKQINQVSYFGLGKERNALLIPESQYYTPDIEAMYAEYDSEKANQLLDEAGFDRTKPIELWFNAGGGNDAWVEAVGNQLRTNLGVEFALRGDLAPPEYGPLMFSKGMTGPFRMGWSMDYPSPQNFLEPLYSTQAQPPAGSNTSFYGNAAFDSLVDKGNEASSSEEAIAFYNQAEDVLLEDMPIIPLFFDVTQSVHSTRVGDLAVDLFGRVDTAALTLAG